MCFIGWESPLVTSGPVTRGKAVFFRSRSGARLRRRANERPHSADPGAAAEVEGHLLPSSRGASRLGLRQHPRCLQSRCLWSGWMSASACFPWKCGCIGQLWVLLLTSMPRLFAGKLSNCSHPLVPEHGGFRCEPSPCRGFPHRSSVRVFCEAGYRTDVSAVSRCHRGVWRPRLPAACVRVEAGGAQRNVESGFNVASTAAGVSIFLLTTTACLVVKSRLCTCLSHRRRPSDQLDLMGEGLPVQLPSYEEAVYGSWGQRLPARSLPPGPTQLLLARLPPGDRSGGGPHPFPAHAPPSYEETQSHGGDRTSDVRRLHLSLSDDKYI
ncbi:sushi domain-containing protein 4 isoform X2 [Nerophis ophidion]|uniref:sushi domain-containing protein 4 isoform X2 n=1 Tax=Nerophis ophidion TaxID=159077 RepID=UPI002ADF11B8|nr:sushi domain-containing protein 4 isoform X2 [Nerophis ophidion]